MDNNKPGQKPNTTDESDNLQNGYEGEKGGEVRIDQNEGNVSTGESTDIEDETLEDIE